MKEMSWVFLHLAGGGRVQMLVVWGYYVKITYGPPSFLTRLDGRMLGAQVRLGFSSLLSSLVSGDTLCLSACLIPHLTRSPDTPGSPVRQISGGSSASAGLPGQLVRLWDGWGDGGGTERQTNTGWEGQCWGWESCWAKTPVYNDHRMPDILEILQTLLGPALCSG